MTRAIGGDFHLPLGLLLARKKKNLPNKQMFLDSGRSCLKAVIEAENPKKVLLPAYLCDSVLLPFKEKKVKMIFYRVNQQLTIDEKDLFERMKREKPDMTVLIHYFGWIQPGIETIIGRIRKQHPRCVIIEDLVQSYLTAYQPGGDYWFNSYRKFLPVADGAFIAGKKKLTEPKKAASSATRKAALLLKNIPGMRHAARKLFLSYEHSSINSGVRAMSWLSRRIAERIDEKAVISIRRRNYQHLAALLNESGVQPLFPKLLGEVCPLGLPIMIGDKDAVQRQLIQKKIYCPVHWRLPKDISAQEFPVSYMVSKQILTIPIDQRYTEKDMEWIAQCLKKII